MTELPAQIVLFQCLPKGDKMELVVQKAVELGVSRIIPVASEALRSEAGCEKGGGQGTPMECHFGKCGQAVQADGDPGGGSGDDL